MEKKVKLPDGTFKTVPSDYKLQTGEEFVAETSPELQAFETLAKTVAGFQKTLDELSTSQKANGDAAQKMSAEFAKLIQTPATVIPFQTTAPAGIQVKGHRSFGLDPESNATHRQAIIMAANATQKHTGTFGKYKDFKEFTTHTEGTDATVGYMVVDEFDTNVIQSLGKYGKVLEKVQIKPTQTDTINLTGLDTAPSVTVGAEATAMSAATNFAVSRPTVSIKRGQAYLTISNELAMDAAGLAAEIGLLVPEAMAKKIETDLINATGLSTEFGTGIFSASAALTEALASANLDSMNWDDFVDAESNLDDIDTENAIYGMHKTLKGYVRKVKNLNGDPIFQKTTVYNDAGKIMPLDNINGYPIVTSPGFPTSSAVNGVSNKTFGFLCNPAKIVRMYSRMGMSMDILTQGTDPDGVNHNSTFTTGFRFWFRLGFTIVVPEDIDGNATSLVLLKTPA